MQGATIGIQRVSAKAVMYSAVLFGRVSLLLFVLFVFGVPFSLVEMNLTHFGCFAWDALFSLLFFIQHSGMIRRRFRARMAGRIPDQYYRATFTLASSLVLALVVVSWQPSGLLIAKLQGPLRWVARGAFFAAAAGIAWGFGSLKGFDPYGIAPIQAQLSGKPLRSSALSIKGPYLWVRHPLYFFVLVMLWSCPDLTADRLLFNLLWTGWIFTGAVLEEKDLLAEFGDDYRKYQRQVPMVIPWRGSKSK